MLEVWGCMHALTTLNQLISYNSSSGGCYILVSGPFTLQDFPRFPYRSVMLVTARHFYPLPTLYTLLDAMAMVKYNVLHWHLIDDQSFPLIIPGTRFTGERLRSSEKTPPQIVSSSSSSSSASTFAKYTLDDVTDIVDYAAARGIRVVPEMDVPGHSASWCAVYPEICISCNTGAQPFALDPSNNNTLTLINQVLHALRSVFVDDFIHLGGDEIDLHCWIQNPVLLQYLQAKYPKASTPIDAAAQEAYTNFIPAVQAIAIENNYSVDSLIHWEDPFDFSSPLCGNLTPALNNQTILQVFRAGWGPDSPSQGECGANTVVTTAAAVRSGYRVIWMPPSSWYLSCYADSCDTSGAGAGFQPWESMYLCVGAGSFALFKFMNFSSFLP